MFIFLIVFIFISQLSFTQTTFDPPQTPQEEIINYETNINNSIEPINLSNIQTPISSELISSVTNTVTNTNHVYYYSNIASIPQANFVIINPNQNTNTPKLRDFDAQTITNIVQAMRHIRQGNLDDLNNLLKNGLNPNIRVLHDITNGVTALMEAVSYKRLPITKLLIDYGADINTTSSHQGVSGITALSIASLSGPYELVQTLLLSGANPNIQTSGSASGYTALIAAISGQQDLIVKLLLEAGSDVDILMSAGSIYNITPLMIAAQKGNPNIINKLLNINTNNINARDSEGKTALDYAYLEGNIEVIQALITKEAKSFFSPSELKLLLQKKFQKF